MFTMMANRGGPERAPNPAPSQGLFVPAWRITIRLVYDQSGKPAANEVVQLRGIVGGGGEIRRTPLDGTIIITSPYSGCQFIETGPPPQKWIRPGKPCASTGDGGEMDPSTSEDVEAIFRIPDRPVLELAMKPGVRPDCVSVPWNATDTVQLFEGGWPVLSTTVGALPGGVLTWGMRHTISYHWEIAVGTPRETYGVITAPASGSPTIRAEAAPGGLPVSPFRVQFLGAPGIAPDGSQVNWPTGEQVLVTQGGAPVADPVMGGTVCLVPGASYNYHTVTGSPMGQGGSLTAGAAGGATTITLIPYGNPVPPPPQEELSAILPIVIGIAVVVGLGIAVGVYAGTRKPVAGAV